MTKKFTRMKPRTTVQNVIIETLTLPNNKFLDVNALKVFADDKLNVAKMMIFLLDSAENSVGNGGKCLVPAFSSFPTLFSKAFFFKVVKKS